MKRTLKTKFAAPAAGLAAALAFSAFAPSIAQAHPYNDARVEISYRGGDFDFRGLQHRVNQGVRSGDLNRREASRLNWQIDELRDRAYRYERNGLTRWERRELRDRYAQLSDEVYRQKHDDQYRGRNWR